MRKYTVILRSNDYNNSNGIRNYTEYEKEVNEDIFNAIYKLLT